MCNESVNGLYRVPGNSSQFSHSTSGLAPRANCAVGLFSAALQQDFSLTSQTLTPAGEESDHHPMHNSYLHTDSARTGDSNEIHDQLPRMLIDLPMFN